MPLDYEMLMSLPPREVRQSHSARDTILYALGVVAADDLDANPASLKFLYEEGLQALPTMAAVAAYPGLAEGAAVRARLAANPPWRAVHHVAAADARRRRPERRHHD